MANMSGKLDNVKIYIEFRGQEKMRTPGKEVRQKFTSEESYPEARVEGVRNSKRVV